MSSPPESSSSSTSTAPWLLNACRTFTSLRARQVTGTHLLHIDGFSTADRMLQKGDYIESRTFTACGHKWRLCFFPNGYDNCRCFKNGYDAYKAGPAPATAVEIELMNPGRHRDDEVVAAYGLSILGLDGSPALSYNVGQQRFTSASKYRHRVAVLVTPEERQAALCLVQGHDTLAVRCDLSVTKFVKESRLKWYLRKLLD